MPRSKRSRRLDRDAARERNTEAPEVTSSDAQKVRAAGSEEAESSSLEPASTNVAPHNEPDQETKPDQTAEAGQTAVSGSGGGSEVTRAGPAKAPGRIRLLGNGLLEDMGWTAADKRKSGDDDPRTLEELAASVMASLEEPPPPESAVEEPAPPDEAGPAPPEDATDEPSETGSKARWAVLVTAGLLLFIGGVCLLRPGLDSGGAIGDSGAPAAVESPKDVGKPKPSPTPTSPPSEAEAGDAPLAAAAPTPTPAPQPTLTAAPKPTPTPKPPSAHVGDLDGSAEQQGLKRAKLTVTIYVHNGGHSPIAGATVSGQWTGGVSGPASCVTGPAGTCVVATKPLDAGGSATFTVGGIDAGGLLYDPALSHDPDGDSNGKSITVTG